MITENVINTIGAEIQNLMYKQHVPDGHHLDMILCVFLKMCKIHDVSEKEMRNQFSTALNIYRSIHG